MANGISVAIGADTREYARGVKAGMIDPVTNAAKELEQLAQAGQGAGNSLERSFSEQQQATQRLQGDIDGLNVKIKEGTSSAAGSMSSHYKKAAGEADEGFKELKDSAKQNSIQTAASFDGSFSSISGGVQGLLSEFLAGFGPAGLIAGLVAAGGIGLLTQAIEGAGAATQADKQAAADLAKQYIDTGSEGKRAFSDVRSSIEDMATSTDGSAIITLQDAWSAAGTAGADYREVVESIASADPAQISSALRRVQALKDTHEAQVNLTRATGASSAADLAAEHAHEQQQAAVGKLEGALKKAATQATLAGRAQELAAAAGISQTQQKIDLINQLHTGYTGTAGAAADFEDKESGLFDVSKYLTAMKKRQQALEDYQNTLATATLTPEAKSYIESLGADDAAAFMAGYKKASPRQRQELDNVWTAAGRSNAQSYGDALGQDLNGMRIAAPKLIPPNTEAYKRAIREAQAEAQAYLERHPLRAGAVAYTVNGKPIY